MAGADGKYPIIPTVTELTKLVLDELKSKYATQIDALQAELPKSDIESILSRVRSLSKVIGDAKIHGLDGAGFEAFGTAICESIGKIVNARLPAGETAYSNLVNWVAGTSRDHPIEIFTTNYDLLLEEAFEAVRAPYFDGFVGGRQPFFDPVSVARNDLPPRWSRIWKLHGSLGWCSGDNGEVIRNGDSNASHLVFPEHLKYDQTQKAPYSSLLDRLREFLATPDSLLLAIGFSFSDAHVSARIDESLAGNPSASVFAFMFNELDSELNACDLAAKRPNFSVYARDKAMMNGIRGAWALPPDLPSKDWGPIRATYWGSVSVDANPEFLLGATELFCRFLAASRAAQAAFSPAVTVVP